MESDSLNVRRLVRLSVDDYECENEIKAALNVHVFVRLNVECDRMNGV